jgi:hypothetical protein
LVAHADAAAAQDYFYFSVWKGRYLSALGSVGKESAPNSQTTASLSSDRNFFQNLSCF